MCAKQFQENLSELRYIVDLDTRKLFFNAHIKPHIDYASVVWDGCSDVLKKRLNFRVIAFAMTGHLRPTLYTHRTPSDCL